MRVGKILGDEGDVYIQLIGNFNDKRSAEVLEMEVESQVLLGTKKIVFDVSRLVGINYHGFASMVWIHRKFSNNETELFFKEPEAGYGRVLYEMIKLNLSTRES